MSGLLRTAFVLLAIVIVLAVVAPCVLQQKVNDNVGNGDNTVDNIRESVENTGDALNNVNCKLGLDACVVGN